MSRNRPKSNTALRPARPVWIASQNAVSKQIGYVRVSQSGQTTVQQIDRLREAGCSVIYGDDGLSGANRERLGLRAALDELRAGDVLCVASLDRLVRDLGHLLEIARLLEERGCELRSLREGIDTTTAVGRFTFQLFGAIAEFERAIASERTHERLAAKKRRGERIGRKPALSPADVAEARVMLGAGKSATYVAQRFRVGRATLYRHLSGS